jgi:sugar phosphate isomerase/epimerase
MLSSVLPGSEGCTTMRLSCLPVSFFGAISHGQMTLAEWLDFAAELGLDGVECGPLLIQPMGPAKPAEFRRLAEARGLAISNFTGYSDFVHPDPQVREREVAGMIENLDIALELGAPSVRALTGQQRPGVDEEQGIKWVVEGVRRVAEEADRVGLRLNVENHTKAATWTNFDFAIRGEVFLRIMEGLRDVPVGVQFDTANPLVAGEETLALFEQVRSRIGYVHLNDVRQIGVFEFVPIGTGLAPIREVLARLREQGYAGWVGIEEASRTGRQGFHQAVQYARRALGAS